MRVLELFSGYGSQALALENLGIDFTSDISEIDKYAIDAYNQLHGYTKNWGDITKIDEKELPYYDLITYSFPCQDISLAGLQKGLDKDSETRSSLLWECERIIRAVKPKYLLMENVKNLVGEKHKPNFIRWLRVLEMMGYQNYWKVLNAKDYGVPQNRERVFVVSILGFEQYLFPNPIKLEKRLKDVLEHDVDEKYYLSDNMLKYISDKADKPYNYPVETSDISDIRNTPLRSGGDFACIKEPICIGGMQKNQSVKTDGISTCLTSSMGTGGGYVPMVTEPLALDEQNNYIRTDGIVGTLTTDGSSPKHNNRVIEPKVVQVGNIVNTGNWDNPQRGRIYSDKGCCPALNTAQGGGLEPKITENYRIRKLTPRECWRLMGVKDEQFDKISGISNSQLYKLAGNSIVVDVLMGIFKNLLLSDEGTNGQLTLF